MGQRNASGAWYYYLFDGLGSVVGLVDTSGNVVARYGYDPYGQTVVKTGAAAEGNPWRYVGAYLDGTGLYKMGARYYDAARGRFTQLDPLGGGYVYASDDPINRIDPTGLDDDSGDNDGGKRVSPERYARDNGLDPNEVQREIEDAKKGAGMGAGDQVEVDPETGDIYPKGGSEDIGALDPPRRSNSDKGNPFAIAPFPSIGDWRGFPTPGTIGHPNPPVVLNGPGFRIWLP